MLVGSWSPNKATIYDVATARSSEITVDDAHSPQALLSDDQLLAKRYDPPYDPHGGNPAAVLRRTLGFDLVGLLDEQVKPVLEAEPAADLQRQLELRGDISGASAIFAAPSGRLVLVDIARGEQADVELAGYHHGDIALFITRE